MSTIFKLLLMIVILQLCLAAMDGNGGNRGGNRRGGRNPNQAMRNRRRMRQGGKRGGKGRGVGGVRIGGVPDSKNDSDTDPNDKVSKLPVAKLTAANFGTGRSLDAYLAQVDRELQMVDQIESDLNKKDPGANNDKVGQDKMDEIVNPSGGGLGDKQNEPVMRTGGKSRAMLRPDGWIESEPGEDFRIPLQTATPNIPREVIAYFEKSRKNDLKLAAAIEKAENARVLKETYWAQSSQEDSLHKPLSEEDWKDSVDTVGISASDKDLNTDNTGKKDGKPNQMPGGNRPGGNQVQNRG